MKQVQVVHIRKVFIKPFFNSVLLNTKKWFFKTTNIHNSVHFTTFLENTPPKKFKFEKFRLWPGLLVTNMKNIYKEIIILLTYLYFYVYCLISVIANSFITSKLLPIHMHSFQFQRLCQTKSLPQPQVLKCHKCEGGKLTSMKNSIVF